MNTIIGGLPGHGKTLYAISVIAQRAKDEDRPVYYGGIPDCKVPGWLPIPGANEFIEGTNNYTPEALAACRTWHTLPHRAIIIIDEAHQVFPQRPPSTPVPVWVEPASTLRKKGHDLILITQVGGNIDHFIRGRVGRYLHVWRPLGLNRATVWEFPKWCDWEDWDARKLAVKTSWAYPKEAFGLYKSAEVHTVRRRLPAKLLVLPLGALVFAALCFAAYKFLFSGSIANGKEAAGKVSGVVEKPRLSGDSLAQSPVTPQAKTAQEYLKDRIPRFPDMPESAPLYDKLASPTTFPIVSACVATASRCWCYSQQGTRLASVSQTVCEQFAKHGSFNHYAQPRDESPGPVRSRVSVRDNDHAAGFTAPPIRSTPGGV